MNRKWIVKTQDKEHIIEADYGAFVRDVEESPDLSYQRDGKLSVDGKEIKTWKELPKEVSFEQLHVMSINFVRFREFLGSFHL